MIDGGEWGHSENQTQMKKAQADDFAVAFDSNIATSKSEIGHIGYLINIGYLY